MKKLVILLISMGLVGLLTSVTLAQGGVNNNQGGVNNNQGGVNDNGSSGSTVNLTNPISSDSIPALIGRVITAVLGVVGSIALLMVIYGGFTWMLAAGNSEKIKKGRDIIVWAMLGLVVIFTSYALVRFVITSI